MKIGIISDIHGNQYALEEVFKDAKKIGIEKFLVLGDIVGYYYHPERILSMLSEWPFEIIKGNHEVILQDLKDGKIDPAILKGKYGSGHEQALKKLNPEQLQWLFSLPVQKTVVTENVTFQLNHGSPWSIDEYLYPDSPVEKLDQCNSLEHDFVLIGHSHYSFSYKCNNSILINCGSVGQSRQKGGQAYWAVVDSENKKFELKATPYDTSKLLNEVKEFDSHIAYSSKVLSR